MQAASGAWCDGRGVRRPWDAHRANSNPAGAALSGALLPHTSSGASREGLASLPYASQDNGALVGAAQVAETGVAPAEASLPPPPPPVRVPERDSSRTQRCRSWAGHDSKARPATCPPPSFLPLHTRANTLRTSVHS